MYKSPIQVVTDDIEYDMRTQIDENIYRAVLKYGVVVDKDELGKALIYDREQYDKGYSDGYARGKSHALYALKKELIEWLKEDNENDE